MFVSKLVPALLAVALGTVASVRARLGENEEQSAARYGDPQAGLVRSNDQPLMPGAKELAYLFHGWRVRVAFANGVTHRIEYAKIPDAQRMKKITEKEVLNVLGAEQGQPQFRWREEKPATGHPLADQLKQTFDGRRWERTDHAEAKLKLNLIFQFETREAERLAKQLAKANAAKPQSATPKPDIPKY